MKVNRKTTDESKTDSFPNAELLRSRREGLVRHVQTEGVTNPDVLEALRVVPRQPTIVGLMSQWAIAGATKNQRRRVLEIGTGSGYQAAILAELFDEVFSVEVRTDLADRSKKALRQLSPRAQRVHCVVGDGALGLIEFAPFDAVVVTAAAERVPPALIEQLRPSGRLVIPLVAGSRRQLLHLFLCVERDGIQVLETVRTLPVLFVPLISASLD